MFKTQREMSKLYWVMEAAIFFLGYFPYRTVQLRKLNHCLLWSLFSYDFVIIELSKYFVWKWFVWSKLRCSCSIQSILPKHLVLKDFSKLSTYGPEYKTYYASFKIIKGSMIKCFPVPINLLPIDIFGPAKNHQVQ